MKKFRKFLFALKLYFSLSYYYVGMKYLLRIMKKNSGRLSLAYQDLKYFDSDIGKKYGYQIEELDLSHNEISDFQFLKCFPNLHTLILDHNFIQSHVKFPVMPQLHTLWINHNNIRNLSIFISTLTYSFPKLTFLSMMNNDAAPSHLNGGTLPQQLDYRQRVISELSHLEILDDQQISRNERLEAERIYHPSWRVTRKL